MMKVELRTTLFGAKLGNALAGSAGKKKTAPKVSEKDFASNLYKIEDVDVRVKYITKYVQELSKHAHSSSKRYSLSKRLLKQLGKEILHREKSSKGIAALVVKKAVDLFAKKLKVFGKFPKGECLLHKLKKYAKNSHKLKKLYAKCKEDAERKDPELVAKIQKGKAHNHTSHPTIAYVENRVASLNASHVKIGEKVNFILSANPKDKGEIAKHFYHAIIKSDCSLWFTLNEGFERPQFWKKKYISKLSLPGNWKITHVKNKVVAKVETGSSSPQLVKTKLIAKNGKIEKKITHYHYENWPDHKEAPSKRLLLKCAKIAQKHIEKTGSPVGINCRGGVGRTGLLANVIYGIQYIDEQIADGKKVKNISINPTELNYNLRKERRGLVSHSAQFIQLHEVLGEYAEKVQRKKLG